MDAQIPRLRPNYKQIYRDILAKKFPSKEKECEKLLQKEHLSALDVIELNRKIFGIVNAEVEHFNHRHRSYKRSDILQVLDYQKKHQLNNSQLATHFKLSRNTITKWKKMFV